jgi:hypothetical protein
MALKSSTPTVVRITSAQKFTAPNSFTDRHDLTIHPRLPVQRKTFRENDPDPKLVGELGPDEIGKRVVIRSGSFLGTVYGTLLGVHPHGNLVHFTSIQLIHKKELTFRNDTEVVVLDF